MSATILRFPPHPTGDPVGFAIPLMEETDAEIRERAYRKAAVKVAAFRAYHQRVAESSAALQTALLNAADELRNKRT